MDPSDEVDPGLGCNASCSISQRASPILQPTSCASCESSLLVCLDSASDVDPYTIFSSARTPCESSLLLRLDSEYDADPDTRFLDP